MTDKDRALPPVEDRAVVNGAQEVSALRASVPSAELFGKDGLLSRFTVAAQGIHRIAQECRVAMAQQKLVIPDALLESLDQWAFNVMLECAGREEDKIEILLGGAVLDMRDLDRILRWAHAQAIDARSDKTEGLGPQGESAVGATDAPNPSQHTPENHHDR